jgi:hypothetical protein
VLARTTIGPPFDDLSLLPRRRLVAMRAAARELFEVLEECARSNSHPVKEILAASDETFTRWAYYPPDPVGDARKGGRWFYHAHDPSEARPWEEHGHFHCFSLAANLLRSARPIALPPKPEPESVATVHLAAISIDASGVPKRLFATNRWVTGESMHEAAAVLPLIDHFRIRSDRRYALTSRWLSAMLRLYQPQIAWLLHERDRTIREKRAAGVHAFTEDTSVEVLSTAEIDLDAQLAAVERV